MTDREKTEIIDLEEERHFQEWLKAIKILSLPFDKKFSKKELKYQKKLFKHYLSVSKTMTFTKLQKAEYK